jgi:hypothetical protein
MKFSLAILSAFSIGFAPALKADNLSQNLASWHIADSGRYARIWATRAQETTERGGCAISSLTTWDFGDYAGVTVGDQPLPVYAGVQGISYSDDYVYIKSTGLATNTMGPWFLDAAQTTQFPSFPGNAAILYRFPRSTNYPANYAPATRKNTNIGTCGLFVDGVPLFNTSDTFSYDTTAFSSAAGGGGPGGPGTGGGGTPGTGSAATGFVFSFADGPPQADLITNFKVGSVTGTIVSYNLTGPTGGTITISFNDSGFTPGSSYRATFNHTPPGSGTATSTNSYTKP